MFRCCFNVLGAMRRRHHVYSRPSPGAGRDLFRRTPKLYRGKPSPASVGATAFPYPHPPPDAADVVPCICRSRQRLSISPKDKNRLARTWV